MASANYASSDNPEELKIGGQDVNLVETGMERDMPPLGNTWDQAVDVSDWSTEMVEEDLRTSGAGVGTLRESEQLQRTTEGGGDKSRESGNDDSRESGEDKSRESGEEGLGVTGQGEPGKVLTSPEVTISPEV